MNHRCKHAGAPPAMQVVEYTQKVARAYRPLSARVAVHLVRSREAHSSFAFDHPMSPLGSDSPTATGGFILNCRRSAPMSGRSMYQCSTHALIRGGRAQTGIPGCWSQNRRQPIAVRCCAACQEQPGVPRTARTRDSPTTSTVAPAPVSQLVEQCHAE